jgi:hypothetical protein
MMKSFKDTHELLGAEMMHKLHGGVNGKDNDVIVKKD